MKCHKTNNILKFKKMTDSELIKNLKTIHQEMKMFSNNLKNCENEEEAKKLWDKYCTQKCIMSKIKLIYEENSITTEIPEP